MNLSQEFADVVEKIQKKNGGIFVVIVVVVVINLEHYRVKLIRDDY